MCVNANQVSLCNLRTVYGFKWGLKTWRDEKANNNADWTQSFQRVHTRVSIGPTTCRQGEVETMCLVTISRHTLGLSTNFTDCFTD